LERSVSLYALGGIPCVSFLAIAAKPLRLRLDLRNIRLPRILLAIIVGACLLRRGTSFQALLRNPLADSIRARSFQRAALGAILALIAEPYLPLSPALSALLTPLGAFLGAAATIAAVYVLGRREGQIDSTTLLLGGVITASFLSAIIPSLMSTVTSGNTRGMAFWLMGNLSTSFQKSVYWFLGIGFFVAAGAIYTTATDLNLLLAGEKRPCTRRGRASRAPRCLPCRIVLTGCRFREWRRRLRRPDRAPRHAPHVRPDHRTLLPTAALGWPIAVVFADTRARTIVCANRARRRRCHGYRWRAALHLFLRRRLG